MGLPARFLTWVRLAVLVNSCFDFFASTFARLFIIDSLKRPSYVRSKSDPKGKFGVTKHTYN